MTYHCTVFRKNESTLKEAMQRMVDHYRLGAQLNKLTVDRFWSEEMGPMVNRYTEKLYLNRNGELIIKVASAPLRNELNMRKPMLKKRINEYLGKDTIRHIKIV